MVRLTCFMLQSLKAPKILTSTEIQYFSIFTFWEFFSMKKNVFFTFKSAQRAYNSPNDYYISSVHYLGAFNGEFMLFRQ